MNANLTFDFTVNKETHTVHVTREFDAERQLVWDAYTKAELLDQWWGPKPWSAKTKSMEFKTGGRRLYAMCGPAGEEHWAFEDFITIAPITNFSFSSGFCDKDGNINASFPKSVWSLNFIEKKGRTVVDISIKHESLEAIEMHINMGFKEGFTICLNQLEENLINLTKK